MELLSRTSGDRIRYGRDRLLGFRDACSEAPEELRGWETFGFMIAGTKGSKRNSDLRGPRDRSNCTWAQGEQANSSTPPQRQQQEGAASGPPPAIVKAANPWSARRSAQSEKEKVYRTVKGILNKLMPENYDVLAEQIMQAGINSAEILQAVTLLIYDKAVLEPMFCAMYVQLCVHLRKELPEFPGEQAGDKPVKIRRVLLSACQEEFEGADALREEIKKLTRPEQAVERDEKEKRVKLRMLGNIKLIGELCKQKMLPKKIVHACIQELLGQDPKAVPAEENVEALCHLFTVGKQLEESAKSKMAFDKYFARLKAIGESRALPSRMRFMVRDILDMWSNKWVPRREEMKAKTINEIHAEAEAKLGLRPRMMALRNGRAAAMPGFMPGAGGMMIGMPGILRMSGMARGGRMGDGDQHAGQGAAGQRGVLSGAAKVRLVQEAAVKLEDEFSQKDELKAVLATWRSKENEAEVCRKTSVDKLSVAVASDLPKLQGPVFGGRQAEAQERSAPAINLDNKFHRKSNKDKVNLRELLQRVQSFGN